MLTLTRQGLLLSLSATVIPSQGSSDVPIAVVNDINTYVGYTLEPRVGYYLNGIYKSTVCTYDTSAKNFSVPAEAFKQIGIIDITLALIDNANANHIETCQTVHATVNKAPLGTVVLPDQTTWQDYVNSYMNQLFDSNYKPQFDQIQQDLENLVTEAQQQQQTAEQQQTQIDNAISVMGEYQIVSNDPVQIQFKQGDGTYGDTVNLGDNLASKSMVNAGYDTYSGNSYSGSASDYGIEIGKASGNYKQEGTPTPESPIEPKFFKPKEFVSTGKNIINQFDLDKYNKGVTPTYNIYTIKGLIPNANYTMSSNVPETGVATLYFAGDQTGTNGVFINKPKTFKTDSSGNILFLVRTNDDSGYKLEDFENGTYYIMLNEGETAQEYVPFKGQDTTPLDITLRALPNGVCDTYEDGVITRRVGVVEFDGSYETWAKNSGADYTYQITLPDIALVELSDGNDILNDRFIVKSSSTIISSGEFRRGGGNTVGYNVLVFRYDGLSTDDLTAWETWLKSNPIKVWYELAEPTTEPCEIPRLQSFYPFTNAWCDSVVQPQITWNVLTGKSSILDGNGNLIQQGYMTPQDNLLINSDFRSGVINQKGQTQYVHSSGARTYGIDCWYVTGENSSMATNDEFLSINLHNNGDFGCVLNIDKTNEKYLTFTIQRNLVEAQSVTFDVSTMNENQDYFFDIDDNTKIGIYFWKSSKAYKAWFYLKRDGVTNIDFMKLERGKYFTGMPAWNEAEELLKCQRYLFSCHKISGYGFETGGGNVYIYVNIPTPMKKQGAIRVGSTLQVIGDGAYKTLTISGVNVSSQDNNLVILSGVLSEVGNLNTVKVFELNNFTLDAYDY